jgi:hypothetical protein
MSLPPRAHDMQARRRRECLALHASKARRVVPFVTAPAITPSRTLPPGYSRRRRKDSRRKSRRCTDYNGPAAPGIGPRSITGEALLSQHEATRARRLDDEDGVWADDAARRERRLHTAELLPRGLPALPACRSAYARAGDAVVVERHRLVADPDLAAPQPEEHPVVRPRDPGAGRRCGLHRLRARRRAAGLVRRRAAGRARAVTACTARERGEDDGEA